MTDGSTAVVNITPSNGLFVFIDLGENKVKCNNVCVLFETVTSKKSVTFLSFLALPIYIIYLTS